ncbi:MAG: peptide ABC transporter substrate-binding protein [Thermomicrobiales bacterium]|nr:peptide ABC transporter substrate-binding protein [Thermomicrobiales bacterium]
MTNREKADEKTLAHLTRRRFLTGTAAAAAGMSIAPFMQGVDASPLRQFGLANYLAQTLPDDAAPADQQVYIQATDPGIPRVLDFYEAVYERPNNADLFSEPLVRLNRNFEIFPGAAESWTSNEDGTIWTFKIIEGRTWNDGNPVTAADWVATFQYAADPAHAWDFTWFFQGVIKGWDEAITGDIPFTDIGVRLGENDYELVFEMQTPAPYTPTLMLYSLPLSKVALETHGPLYNTNPETHVSSGPFKLESWVPDQEIVVVKNEQYNGSLVVPVNKVVCKLAALSTHFQLFQTDVIDFMENPAPQELTLAQADPDLSQQLYQGVGDFRTNYLFFDVTQAPFDDLRVRQAFSHVIDRDALVSAVIGIAGTPAYSWLAPGFPASNRDELSSIQNFDPEAAKALLAEAGYPDGEGFPSLELWLRNANALDQNVAAACAAMINEHLGIEVEVSNKDQPLFTASMNANEIQFGFVSYGMDFLDPINMLSVWRSGGRHPWVNEEFDTQLAEAGSYNGDPADRLEMFKEVERILVSDVPGVFVYHATPIQMIKPWVVGAFREPDVNGITALHWPNYTTMSTVPEELYISSEAPSR